MRVKKAIIPAAGLGTRMLPATKSIPKEMLPVADKPLIHYVVEEALNAGIDHILIITAREKMVIEDYFDRHLDLEEFLSENGKAKLAQSIRDYLPPTGAIAYLRQNERLGLGHAIWSARHWVGDEPFAILSPDELLIGKENCTQKLINAYHNTDNGMIIAMQDLPLEQVNRYGVIAGDDGKFADGQIYVKAQQLVEKPNPAQAPSNHCIIGRYILHSGIFQELEKKQKGADGEIQLTDAINHMIGKCDIYGLLYQGERFDCGKRTGWLEANIFAALQNNELSEDMNIILQKYSRPHQDE